MKAFCSVAGEGGVAVNCEKTPRTSENVVFHLINLKNARFFGIINIGMTELLFKAFWIDFKLRKCLFHRNATSRISFLVRPLPVQGWI